MRRDVALFSAVMVLVVSAQLNGAGPPLPLEPSPGDTGVILFPASDVEVEAQLQRVPGHKQLLLRIRVLGLGASAPRFGKHYLVRPGETLFFRSPPEEEEELQFKVFVGGPGKESIFETVRLIHGDVVAITRTRSVVGEK